MKLYKVVQVFPDTDVYDLVNTSNPEERIAANPDDFVIGNYVAEDSIELKNVPQVTEYGCYSGAMAFLKPNANEQDCPIIRCHY